LDQTDLFEFVNPSKLGLSTPRRHILQDRVTRPEFQEAATSPELLFIEEQSVWILRNVLGEPNGRKGSSYIHFHHCLFEIVIELDYECNSA
jgi:hypothetical protein